ncbi:hypothetical protein HMPREF9392_0515 [Streptococcus sanguinis SK678]|nr:hypothetical protein HMPREF9392_0515 [Streptococcus sanguinis SK678]
MTTDVCVLEKTIFLAQSVARVQLRTLMFLSINVVKRTCDLDQILFLLFFEKIEF